MATNWPPTEGTYTIPPEMVGVRFASLQVVAEFLLKLGYTRSNPTAEENNSWFKQVRCDHGDPCQGVVAVKDSIRYCVGVYCTGADHQAGMLTTPTGYDTQGNPQYEMGARSGAI